MSFEFSIEKYYKKELDRLFMQFDIEELPPDPPLNGFSGWSSDVSYKFRLEYDPVLLENIRNRLAEFDIARIGVSYDLNLPTKSMNFLLCSSYGQRETHQKHSCKIREQNSEKKYSVQFADSKVANWNHRCILIRLRSENSSWLA